MKFHLDFIAQATGAKLQSKPIKEFSSYCADSRDPEIQNKIFIALVGENHDSHDFVETAVKNGATGVMVHRWDKSWDHLKKKVSFLLVEDTLKALQDFSLAWRKTLRAQVIAITGSNGKTTTKDFLGQILSQAGPTHVNRGSYNNHWGLPMTLLDGEPSHKYIVTEMGMNHSGEITNLVAIAQPNIVTVVNVGRAHIGNFSDGIDGVAKAKEEIYQASGPQTRFVFNFDNPYTLKMSLTHKKSDSIFFSTKDQSADVFLSLKNKKAQSLEVTGHIKNIKFTTDLQFWGDQNVENLAAASSLALAAGLDPQSIIDSFQFCSTGWGRNQWIKLKSGATTLFDAYNANPDSFDQLFKNLQTSWSKDHQYFGIFGEMRELGEQTQSEHYKLGQRAAEFNWSKCLFIGPSGESFRQGYESKKNQIKPIILDTYEQTLDLDLHSMLNQTSLIIIKGSRGSALERIVKRLQPLYFPDKN